MKAKIIVLLVIIASLLIVGCVGDDSQDQSTDEIEEDIDNESQENVSDDEVPEEEVEEEVPAVEPQEWPIRLYAYRTFPSYKMEINRSDTVVWQNLERENKRIFTLVSEDGLWEDKKINYMTKFNYTFEEAGTYKFTIPPWNAMNMTIIVN
ncbi:MAG: hypothetical protein U9N13_02120 [Euryarchaeota archaeon]|nr:hypothetical protein [Euryarchaeota archaeon]